jgi:hypothetical protein
MFALARAVLSSRFQDVSKAEHAAHFANARPKRNPLFPAGSLVERTGIEPVTSGLQSQGNLGSAVVASGQTVWLRASASTSEGQVGQGWAV